jgi:drug/metabolite transporter (DMT)-like permease
VTRLTALAGIVAISFSAIFFRLSDVSATTGALFRVLYAIPVLIVIARFGTDRRNRRERVVSFIAGMLLASDLFLWHSAIEYIGAGLATVLANVQVVWVGLVAWAAYRERPTPTAIVVVPLVLFGITLIGGLGREDAFGERPLLGAALGTAASVCYSGFLLLFRASNRSQSHTAPPLLDATAGAAVALLMIAPFESAFSFEVTWPAHGWLVALALSAQVAGWLLIATALPRLPALETSVMLLIQPALTIVWARIIFSEALSAVQWAGVVVVMAGVAVAGARGSVRREAVAGGPQE